MCKRKREKQFAFCEIGVKIIVRVMENEWSCSGGTVWFGLI